MNRAVARTHFYRRAPGSKFAPLNKEYGFLEFRNFTAKSKKKVSGLSKQGVVCCVVDERRLTRMAQKKLLTNGKAFKRTDDRWGGTVWYID